MTEHEASPKHHFKLHESKETQELEKELPSFKTTENIKISNKIIDQILGQDSAVEIVRKAAAQRRNVLLLGSPGTGKSMLAQGMAELMPAENLRDALSYPNEFDENNPKITTVLTYPQGLPPENATEDQKMGQGRRIILMNKMKKNMPKKSGISPLLIILIILLAGLLIFQFVDLSNLSSLDKYSSIIAAVILGGLFFLGMWMFLSKLQMGGRRDDLSEPKLVVDNTGRRTAPFIEATGAKAGALFGDVKHDPLQCIPGNELVHLPNGKPTTISKLIDPIFEMTKTTKTGKKLREKEQFEVLAGCDEKYVFVPSKVSDVFRRKYDGELVEVTTRRGYKINVTPNHPLAIFNSNGGISYIKAEDVEKGSYVTVPEKLPINAKSELNKKEIIFLADLLADGSVNERNVLFKLRNQFKIDTISKDIERLGFKPRILKRGKDTLIYLNSSDYIRRLNRLGLKAKNTKSIPGEIYDGSKEEITLFLCRYLSLDGYLNKQGQFELLSKEMIPDFIPLLLKIGVKVKYKPRIDRGFKKGNLQHRIIFSNYEFAKTYAQQTINPTHQINAEIYLNKTNSGHVTYDDTIPIKFDVLETFRTKIGLSKEKIDDEYYALKPGLSSSKTPTRGMLAKVLNVFMQHTNGKALFALRDTIEGTYAYDEITEIKKIPFSGYVYNMTTETGTYIVNNVLTHNTGGLGTPPHLRVEAGAVHRADLGVLYIDEVGTINPKSQQDLLTAMQEKKYSITGQSEMSSGALTRTEPVPCDFVLVAAGNLDDLQKMHPALRSRIRGYGYEIYLNDTMPDTKENREKLVKFVAQEVRKDGKIPHFTKDAVIEIIKEAKRKAGRKHKLTLKLRELGGLIRAAGDIAKSENAKVVDVKHVIKAKGIAKTIEQQLSHQIIEARKEYSVIETSGRETGKVNGLAVLGDASSGLVMPIVAEVTPASSKFEGKVIATGKLGEIAKEAVNNVSAIIKKHMKRDVTAYDVHIQFLQTYEGVEGDSASISVALAVLSAMEGVAIKQDVAMTGSLSVRGEVLPVGGVTAKVEAAIDAGLKTVIVPKENLEDIVLSEDKQKKVKIIPAESLIDVIENAIEDSAKKRKLISELKKELRNE